MTEVEELHVLLVEDTTSDELLVRDALDQCSEFRVHLEVAGTIAEAMAKLQSARFDLVLLDLTLPDGIGADTVRRLRSSARNVAIVVVTAIDDTSIGIAAMKAGAQDYILKRQLNPTLLQRRARYALERQRLQTDRQEMNERLQLLAARLVAVREEERTRMAREIHDELGQGLTTCKFDVVWLESHVDDPRATAAIKSRLRELQQHVDATLQSVRRIALELRPSALDHLGLVEAMRDEARRFQYRTGVTTRLDVPDHLVDVEADLGTTCFRIFQELLTNVARHARASSVDVSLSFENGELVLRVSDDGVGMDGSTRTGAPPLGIIGMQERAAAHGGNISFDSDLGQGTHVVVRLATTERMRSIAC